MAGRSGQPVDKTRDPLTLSLKLKANARLRQSQEESGLTPEQWAAQKRARWRWSAGPTRGMIQTAADLLTDFNTGITGLLGPTIQDALAEISIGRGSTEPPRMGIIGRGAEVAGTATSMALGGELALGRKVVQEGLSLAAREIGTSGTAAKLLQQITGFAERHPKTFLASEAAGGFGSGVGGELPREAGGGEFASTIGSMAGGMLTGAIPVTGMNTVRQGMNWALLHLAPWTESGGSLYAARRLQRIAGNPEQAAERVRKGRAGISPARRTQDKNLLALEANVLENDPQLAQQFAERLQEARRIAQQELRNEVGELRQPGEWERAVIEKAAVPGTQIKQGSIHKMLEQAHKSFRPLYEGFSGFPVRPRLEAGEQDIPLRTLFKMGLNDPNIAASKSERKAAIALVKSELGRVSGGAQLDDTTFDSSVFLTMRGNIRDRIRELSAVPDRAAHITARLLSNAEASITQVLEQQLPAGALQTLRQIDGQHDIFRIIQQAVFTAGDRSLSPTALRSAVRKMMPPEEAGEMHKLLRAGKEVNTVIGKPQEAKLLVQDQDERTVSQIQADFLDTLWKRSLTNEVGEDGQQVLSGSRFLTALTENTSTAKALGIASARYNRMVNIAREIQAIDMKSPSAYDDLLDEGPHNILQLMATIVGSKSGQHIAGKGIGSSLVLAGFFAKRARRILGNVFSDQAKKILLAAHNDPKLYESLLTRPTDPVKKQDAAVRTLQAWIAASGVSQIDSADEVPVP